jgi:hypothetical protein
MVDRGHEGRQEIGALLNRSEWKDKAAESVSQGTHMTITQQFSG